MVGSHKILTVSYGTFSCTLEGFDDSFETMKAIAEYFRDLAAEDRYFGAEPPVPDAEMLARIASKEASRRVEARMEASGVVLRVGSALGTADEGRAPVSAPAPVAEMPPMPPAVKAPDTIAAPSDQRRVVPTLATEAPQPPVREGGDGVAAKLQRIRDVVGRAAAGSLAQGTDRAAEAVAPEAVPAQVAAPALPTPAAAETAAPDEEAAFDDFPEAPLDPTEAAPEPPVAAAPIRPRVVRMRRADFERAIATGAVVKDEEPAAEAVDARAGVVAEPLALAADQPGALSPEAEAELLAELALLEAERGDEEGGAGAEAEPEAMAAEAGKARPDVEAADDDASAPGAGPAPAEAPEAVRPEADAAAPDDGHAARAAVGDLMASLGLAPATAHEAAQTPAKPAAEAIDEPVARAAPLPMDAARDEAQLADEGAEADLPSRDDEDASEAQPSPDATPGAAPAPVEEAAPARAAGAAPDLDEAAVSRLLTATDAHLAEPEASRRREAIAQLKAAVAATEAARRLGEAPPDAGERLDPFRDDLRQAVRPRRAAAATASAARMERPRPAPLKLVASQRVDLPIPAVAAGEGLRVVAVQPIRPRRVTTEATGMEAAPAASLAGGSFEAFAAEMGATSLIDILEAAAAYVAFVEGAEDFSRPQIIDKVRQVAADRFSREDGLRSFGTLLRQGRITRLGSGRFGVGGDIRFNPGRRAV